MTKFKIITKIEELPENIVQEEEIGIINLETGEKKVIQEISFKCHSTTACCRLHTIPLTEEDVLRIEQHGYELFQFLEETSPIIVKSKIRKGNYTKAYILKKKPFTNECVFLEDNKCKIHDFKPIACRLYPFSIRKSEVNENIVKVIVHPESVCTSVKKCTPLEYSKQYDEKEDEVMGSQQILEYIYEIIKEKEVKTP